LVSELREEYVYRLRVSENRVQRRINGYKKMK
jgi:hypothetical protein